MSLDGNSWEEDFNSVITKRRRYFVTDKNKIKKICQMHFNLCNLEVKRLILLM